MAGAVVNLSRLTTSIVTDWHQESVTWGAAAERLWAAVSFQLNTAQLARHLVAVTRDGTTPRTSHRKGGTIGSFPKFSLLAALTRSRNAPLGALARHRIKRR